MLETYLIDHKYDKYAMCILNKNKSKTYRSKYDYRNIRKYYRYELDDLWDRAVIVSLDADLEAKFRLLL